MTSKTCRSEYVWDINKSAGTLTENCQIYYTHDKKVLFRWGLVICILSEENEVTKCIKSLVYQAPTIPDSRDLGFYLVSKGIVSGQGIPDINEMQNCKLPFDLMRSKNGLAGGKCLHYNETNNQLCLSSSPEAIAEFLEDEKLKDDLKKFKPVPLLLNHADIEAMSSENFKTVLKEAREFLTTAYGKTVVEQNPTSDILGYLKKQICYWENRKRLSFPECVAAILFVVLRDQIKFEIVHSEKDECVELLESDDSKKIIFYLTPPKIQEEYQLPAFKALIPDLQLAFKEMLID